MVFMMADTNHDGQISKREATNAGNRIVGGFFFEAEATGEPVERALNKIGHALHDLDPVFDRVSRRPRIAGLVGSLGIARPLLLQSMYIFKQPRIGGEVVCHTDHTYLWTDPPSVTGF